MEENEYKDNEKVVYKTRGKLKIPHKEPEEVDCFVTEGNLVIETEEPIKILLLRIKHHQPTYESYEVLPDGATAERSGTVALTYLDHLSQKQRLSLETSAAGATLLNQALTSAIEKAKAHWLELLPVERNWFARHLNWTLVLSWILALILDIIFGASGLQGFYIGSFGVYWSPAIETKGLGANVVLLVILAIVLAVTGWVLRKKNRSLLNLLWYLVPPPIGAIIMLFLRKEPKIV